MSIKLTDHIGRTILVSNPGDFDPSARRNPLVILAFGSGTSNLGATYVATWTAHYDVALEKSAEALYERGLMGVFVPKDQLKKLYKEAKAANRKGSPADWEAESTAHLVYTEVGYIDQTDLHDAGKLAEITLEAIANASRTYHRATQLMGMPVSR